jgi:hypothetical protein
MARSANRRARILLAAFGVAATVATAHAAQPPVAVNCAAGHKITDALAAHPSSNGTLTLLVSGTCTENVEISRFSPVVIQGHPTATLKPVHPTDTPLSVTSHAVLAGIAIAGGSTSLSINRRGFVRLIDSKITGTGTGIFVYDNSSVDVVGSTIATAGSYGIQSGLGSTIFVHADAGDTTEISGARFGIFCNSSKLDLTTTGNGTILISKNKELGIQGFDCGLQTFNPSGAIRITANGTAGSYGAGIELRGGVAILNDVQITNSVGFGAINASLNAGMQLNHVTMTGNVSGVHANQGAIVQFVNFHGASTVKSNGTHVFSCFQGGQIYVDKLAGEIIPIPTPAQLGCLHVGGP